MAKKERGKKSRNFKEKNNPLLILGAHTPLPSHPFSLAKMSSSPKSSSSLLSPSESFVGKQKQIAFVKNAFSRQLEKHLGLAEVQAPLLSTVGDGIQDGLSGTERAVEVKVKVIPDERYEVVHSLAKWKRKTLGDQKFRPGEGIYTHMRAVRADEERLSPIHSVLVDQWDWEMVIGHEDRCVSFLKSVVEKIYAAIKETECAVASEFHMIPLLPPNITFIHSEELLAKYPNLSPNEREEAIAEECKAVFIIGIGGPLANGKPHDVRAPDYDDWSSPYEEETTLISSDSGEQENEEKRARPVFHGLNGDIIVWNPVLQSSVELSSMGIRVTPEVLQRQMALAGKESDLSLDFHKKLLAGDLPQTIGGGIGQSRLVMFLLQRKHIAEVQVGVWPKKIKEEVGEELML